MTEQMNITSLLPSSQLAGHSAVLISNIINLYNALLKASAVSASASPTGAGETSKVDWSTPEPVDLVKTTSREYRLIAFLEGRRQERKVWLIRSLSSR